MDPVNPQPILAPITEAAIFLTWTVAPGGEDDLRDALANVTGLKRSVGIRVPEADLSCVVGIGAELWDRLFGAPRPAGLHSFRAVAGATHHAPATGSRCRRRTRESPASASSLRSG